MMKTVKNMFKLKMFKRNHCLNQSENVENYLEMCKTV